MITADVARTRSEAVESDRIQIQIRIVEKEIEEAISEGKFHARIEDITLLEGTQDLLIERGFKVDYFNGQQGDRDYWEVIW